MPLTSRNIADSGIPWVGKYPSDWTILRVKNLVQIKNGQNQTSVESEYGFYPILGTGGEFGRANNFLHRGPSVLLGRKGTIDKPQFINEPFWTVDTLFYTEIKETTDAKFFYYLSQIFPFHYLQESSAVPSMTQEKLHNIEVAVPVEKEQTQIAAFLDHKTALIDQLIEKNERLLELLDEQRQAIINEAVTKGLDPNAKMKDSGIEWLGEIPEGWEVGKIGYVADVVRGSTPRPAGDPKYFNGNSLPWITVGEVTNASGKYIETTKTRLTDEGVKKSRVVEPETLLLSNSGATLGVPRVTQIRGCINDGSIAFLNLLPKVERDFLYYYLQSLTKKYREESAGYGQPNLNTEIVKNTVLPFPPIAHQKKVVKHLDQSLECIERSQQKIAQILSLYTEYRQSLISEAVTGKIDLREWELPSKEIQA